MPPAIAVAAAAIAIIGPTALTIAGIGLGATLSTISVLFGISLGLSTISAALAPKPNLPKLEERKLAQLLTVRDPVRSKEIVVGTSRKGGTIVFITTVHFPSLKPSFGEIWLAALTPNRFLHLVVVLAGHEVAAIKEVYFNEDLAFDAAGNAQGDFSGKATLSKHLGADDQAADSQLITDLEGFPIEDGKKGSDNITAATQADPVVITSADHRLSPGQVVFIENASGMTELNDREFIVGAVDTNTFELKDEDGTGHSAYTSGGTWKLRPWSTRHRLRGIAYIVLKLTFDRDVYKAGVPNISAVIEGLKLFDPRDESTAHSENAALALAAYLNHPVYGLAAPYDTEIAEDALIAAANLCDELVAIPGGTEKRYTANGTIDSGDTPQRNIEQLLSAMAGRLIWSGGEWIIKAGAYEAPTVPAFTESDLRGNLGIRTRIQRRDLFNAVKGVFVAPKNAYQPGDFPPVKSATYLAEDNGERIWKDIELPFTGSEFMAQRLAKIDLESIRRQITVTFPCSLKGLRVRAGDTIAVTIERMGWVDKPFLVTDWELALHEVEDAPVIGTLMQLREVDSAVYGITAGEQEVLNDAPPAFIGPPSSDLLSIIHAEGDLGVDESITPPKTIFTAIQAFTVTDALLISQGTAAGIDDDNQLTITLYRTDPGGNDDAIASLIFDTTTTFPADGEALSFTSQFGPLSNTEFAINDRLRLELISSTNANPPAFSIQVHGELI